MLENTAYQPRFWDDNHLFCRFLFVFFPKPGLISFAETIFGTSYESIPTTGEL